MRLPQIRGAILEELVLHLLEQVGYRIVQPGAEGTRAGHSGLEVRGRGEWHQIDALAAFDRTPAFMYPLRLMVEAKCYAAGRPVGIEIVRNSVGVLKDISENYFSLRRPANQELQVQRFNYHSAIFSTSGYTAGAQNYALAHQVFLIQYKHISLLVPIVDALLNLHEEHFPMHVRRMRSTGAEAEIRSVIRNFISDAGYVEQDAVFTAEGAEYLRDRVIAPLMAIRGSYFAMLQGRWPMHLLSSSPLPAELFKETDRVKCKIYGRESMTWSFAPVHFREGEPNWFRLQFDLPEEVGKMVQEVRDDPVQIANVKQQQFSYLDIAGRIGGVQRQVRLELDEEWLGAYIERITSARHH